MQTNLKYMGYSDTNELTEIKLYCSSNSSHSFRVDIISECSNKYLQKIQIYYHSHIQTSFDSRDNSPVPEPHSVCLCVSVYVCVCLSANNICMSFCTPLTWWARNHLWSRPCSWTRTADRFCQPCRRPQSPNAWSGLPWWWWYCRCCCCRRPRHRSRRVCLCARACCALLSRVLWSLNCRRRRCGPLPSLPHGRSPLARALTRSQ